MIPPGPGRQRRASMEEPGRALIVNLETGAVETEELAPETRRQVLGGAGLAAWLLLKHARQGVEPLSGENPLILAAAPFSGVGLPADPRTAVAAKSPLSGLNGDSLVSGELGTAIRQLGADALVLAGACPSLSVVVLEPDGARLISANGLMGLSPAETEARLARQLGPGFAIAAIGLAGERQVRFASLAHRGRHAGRTGIGAVCGAKGLKAVAIRGDRAVAVFDPAGVGRAAADLRRRAEGPATERYRSAGTVANLARLNSLGILPALNFRETWTPGIERLAAPGMDAERRVEYESLYALGPLLGIHDPDAVRRAAALCDELGMDTISAGGTLAWAMESVERGLLEAGEIDLGFGSPEGALQVLAMTGNREGIGDLLAEGSRAAARATGGGSEYWAMQVKGLELPGYDPRSLRALALGLAVSPRGACHNRSSAYDADFAAAEPLEDPNEIAGLAIESEDRAALLDSLTVSKFLRRCFADLYAEGAALLAVVTGWQVTPEDLRAVGTRINTLRKRYNIREGWTRAEDTLPGRLLTEPIPSGPRAGAALTAAQLEQMVEAYYRQRGWQAEIQ